MVFSGMDVDAVEAVSKSLKQSAGSLKTLTGDIGREVGRLSGTWEGADARQFADEWWPKHRATLDAITKAIEGLGQSAWNNAQEQRQASGNSSSGSGATPAPTANSPQSGVSSEPSGGSGSSNSADTGPSGTQDYSVSRAIEIAKAEVGSTRPTGWNQEGECIKSVQRWINEAGGRFGGGGVVSGYVDSGAVQVSVNEVRPGDVIQYTSIANPDSFVAGVHTVMVVGLNSDGSYDIVQSNWGERGKVTEVLNWRPSAPKGLETRVWRFAKSGS